VSIDAWPWIARRRWRQRFEAERAALHEALPDAAPDLAGARDAMRRAMARAEPALEQAAQRRALAAVVAALQAAGQARPAPQTLDAALALLHGGAVELPVLERRREAVALAATVAAFGGRPVHLVAAGDEDAAAAAAAMRPLFEACGVRAAVLALETPPAALAAGYRAEVVHAGLRRLAADLARDEALRQRLDPADPAPAVTRGVHWAFVEPLDRVLADEALGPVLLSVADDPSALAPALALARRAVDALQPGTDHADGALTEAGRARIAAEAWPPLWRPAERREALVRQALFVRDGLQRGRDYELAPGGQLWLDETLAERLPDRAFGSALSQALQLRLGVPMAPITRTTGRTSVPGFFARYRRLAGAAPALPGLAAELQRSYGLVVWRAATIVDPRCRTVVAADRAGWERALQHEAGGGADSLARLVVLRRAGDLTALQALVRHPRAAWALEAMGPQAALKALGFGGPQPPAALRVIFAEPPDTARAQQAFLQRAAEAGAPNLDAVRLLHAQSRWLADRLPPAAALLRTLGPLVPRATVWLLPALADLAQRVGARRARAWREAMPQRERQLQQQLSFTPGRRDDAT
jgi:preprotein translocase subunit SecA